MNNAPFSSLVHTEANDLSTNIMSEEQIRLMAPRVFCTAPTNPEVSKRYVLASTDTVIKDMHKLGWEVVMASQPRRRNSSSVSSYHMVSFESINMGPVIITSEKDGVKYEDKFYPRIILTNSHDGFNSFRFMVGLYRIVCANGLIIATDTFSNVRIRHINYTFEDLRNLVNEVVNLVPVQINLINKMQNRILTIDEKRSLALSALRERRNDQELEVSNIILDNILTPAREEDTVDNLWTTFNIIQEKMMKGGFELPTKKGKMRMARQIRAIHKTITLNQAMFKTATSFIAE